MTNLRPKRILMVVALKGGVGKSTLSSSIAAYLADQKGYTVGLWDLDITSPSVPKIFGCQGQELDQGAGMIEPHRWSDNLSLMSLDFLLPDSDQPIIWDADKKSGAIRQFMKSVNFGRLDYLVLDTPPTTSEELLTILELFPKSKMNIIFVTQPSAVSENGVRKSVRFLTESGYPVKGIISNMAGAVCVHCNEVTPLFTDGMGVEEIAKTYKIPYLGAIPVGEKFRPDSFLLDGPNFVEVVEKIMETAPVKQTERFTKRSLMQKGMLAVKMNKRLKKELAD